MPCGVKKLTTVGTWKSLPHAAQRYPYVREVQRTRISRHTTTQIAVAGQPKRGRSTSRPIRSAAISSTTNKIVRSESSLVVGRKRAISLLLLPPEKPHRQAEEDRRHGHEND